jgi:hypothetical protein
MDDYGFTEEMCADFLNDKPQFHNEVAREDPKASIFDSMEAVRGNFDKKLPNGTSINDVFKHLIMG